MDSNILAALISAFITATGGLLTYFQLRKDFKYKLQHLREEVTVELLKLRVEPYSHFMRKLKKLSGRDIKEYKGNLQKRKECFHIFQETLYSEVGLLASHDTRKMIIYARTGCLLFIKNEKFYPELLNRIRAVHIALRSDLGIVQPGWLSEVEKIRKKIDSNESANIITDLNENKHLLYEDVLENE